MTESADKKGKNKNQMPEVFSSENLNYESSLPQIYQMSQANLNPLADIEEYTKNICKDNAQLNDLIKKAQRKQKKAEKEQKKKEKEEKLKNELLMQ